MPRKTPSSEASLSHKATSSWFQPKRITPMNFILPNLPGNYLYYLYHTYYMYCIWYTRCDVYMKNNVYIYIYTCTYIYMYIYIYTQINVIKSTSKPSRFLQGFIRILKRMIIQWKGPLKGGEWENILRSKDFIWWADEASRILLGSSSPKCFHEKCYTLKGRATKQ